MNLCVRLAARPCPETWPRLVVVLVILTVVTVPLLRSGYNLPDLMTFFLGASVAGAQAARPRAALTAGGGRW
jgi:uncharacterized membrane protein YoaK (UPF0700 family)